jgi:hypothetical protein
MVSFDHERLKFARRDGNLEVQYSVRCVMWHGAHYGKVVYWNAESAHCVDILGFLLARLVLEAQAQRLGFLRRAVGAILIGIDWTIWTGSKKWDAGEVEGVFEGYMPYARCAAISVYLKIPYMNLTCSRVVYRCYMLVVSQLINIIVVRENSLVGYTLCRR